jgi:hypothetical protein
MPFRPQTDNPPPLQKLPGLWLWRLLNGEPHAERLPWYPLAAIAAVLITLIIYSLQRGPLNDFDCYWLGSWAIREGVPMRMYAVLDAPGPQGLYSLYPHSSEWAELSAQHLPRALVPWAYIYPPHCAVLLLPLTLLPYSVALGLWRILNLAAYLLCLGLLLYLTRERLSPRAARWLTLLSLATPMLFRVLQLAQISPLLLLSVVGGLYFLHTRRPVAAGVALAFGTVLKLSPILFVLWLLARREYRAFAASLIAMTLLSLLTLAVTGAAPFERFFRHVLPILSQGTTFDYNISIVAIAGWIFDLGSPRRPEFLPPDLRLTLVKLIFYGLVLGVSGWALWRTQRAEAPARLSGEYALINMTLLLISPITWSHHVLHALLPIFLVTVQEISRRRYALLAGAALCYLLILQVPDLPSSLLADWFGAQTGTAAAFIGLVSLWLLACASLSQRDESPPWEREPQDADS